MAIDKDYLKIIKERAKTSHVYKRFQLIGLLIAQLLNDEKHKSLYIMLAKKHHSDDLLHMAKDISERKNIENKGAYFMKVLMKTHPYLLKSSKPKTPKSKKTKIIK
ncbi:hypothetical protein A2999_00935 [Candidatus Wolfebacteria bacterium RIFCSPLOWO2_01_FULL_38_11]|uniref:Uncharacterized protein n=2 Tax=Candidatus Wolfeibacteriota TaxID=1752735 RepID=A0A0G0J2D3_9BACT|nr:MAG: hypothetical protein US36_C0008G0023 [Candidatus Wolfebacteria bacterium GW2011_GWC1_37_10]OGM90483.1 MAG: hypothetical protein A2999_00935 [Candidatus Wolfebacteria bacterium RIFCSPLOWO2_01_FULL_38_11]